MTNSVQQRLDALGLTLPPAAPAVANYVPYVQSGSHVFVSGQLPLRDGKLLFEGHVGSTVSLEDGIAAARQCALNIVAQLSHATGGDLDSINRIVKITGFVAAGPDFTSHPAVINGASDLLVDLFGDRGVHARVAVGCPSLPLNAPVEIDAIAELAGG